MKKRINLLNVLLFAFIFFTSINIHAQDAGSRYNLQSAINARLGLGDKNITTAELQTFHNVPNKSRVSPQDTGGFSHLLFQNLQDVTLDLTGLEIICMETKRAITIENCTNFKIIGLKVDYDPLPFTQAHITWMNGDKSQLNFDFYDGYGTDVLENDNREKIQVFDTNGNLVSPEYYDVTFGINGRSGWMTKIPGGNEQVGDVLVVSTRNSTNVDHTVYADNCSGLVLDNVTLYSGTVFGFYETYCTGSTYSNCKVIRRPYDSNRIKDRGIMRMRSVEADAFHSKYGKNPTYNGCIASNMADDGIAINGDFDVIMVNVNNDNKLYVASKSGGQPDLTVGHTVELVSYTGERLPDAVVTNIGISRALNTTEKDFLINQGFLGDAKNIENATNLYEVTIDRSVNLPMGSLINDADRIGNNFSISNCIIGPNRSRGLLVKASHGTIQNNQLIENWGPAILLSPEYKWLEAGSSVDVDILNNTITNCHDASIAVYSKSVNNEIAPAGAHDDITIIGNNISGSTNPGIAVTSTTKLCMKDNTFQSVNNSYLDLKPQSWNEFGRTQDPNREIYTLNTNDILCPGSTTIDVRSLTVNPVSSFIAFGQQLQLLHTISPENATNQGVSWSSDNLNVATVSTNGLVTASSTQSGIANITVTSLAYPEIKATAVIEVGLQVDAISSFNPPTIVVPEATTSVTVNYSATEDRKIFTYLQPTGGGTWVVSDIRSVPAGTGSFTIDFQIPAGLPFGTGTHEWISYISPLSPDTFDDNLDFKTLENVDVSNTAIRVNVDPTSAFLAFGQTTTINATVLNTPNQTVTWTSTNPSVATVDLNSGLVTAGQGIGTTNIIAKSSADQSQTAICIIEVGNPIDAILSTDWPLVVAPDSSVPVTVNYSATTDRRIYTYLQRNADPYDWVVSDISLVNAGTGTLDLNFTLPAGITVGTNTYQWITYITESPNGGWLEKLAINDDFVDVDNSGIRVTINPESAFLNTNDQIQLNATVIGATNTNVNWSLGDGSGIATVTTSGLVSTGNTTGNTTIIAASAEDPSVFAVFNLEVGLPVDEVISVTGPEVVAPGQIITLFVDYSATEQRNVVVFFKKYGDEGPWAAQKAEVVQAGSGIVEIQITIPDGIPDGVDTYRYGAYITSYPSGGWGEFNDKGQENVDIDANANLSVFDNELKPKLLIYPNPTNSVLNVVVEQKHIGLMADIVDLSGRVLISERLNNTKNSLDLSLLSNGVYMLFTKDGSKVTSVNKIVVSH